jgi:hypothetical protein
MDPGFKSSCPERGRKRLPMFSTSAAAQPRLHAWEVGCVQHPLGTDALSFQRVPPRGSAGRRWEGRCQSLRGQTAQSCRGVEEDTKWCCGNAEQARAGVSAGRVEGQGGCMWLAMLVFMGGLESCSAHSRILSWSPSATLQEGLSSLCR